LKIVFNTKYPESPASMFYVEGLSSADDIDFFNFENYSDYDVALFMTYDKDLEELKKVKKNNPELIVGLIDPRGSKVDRYIEYIDFLIIDSIEMKDFFAKYRLPMHTYYEYPNVDFHNKKHFKKESIIIGYHGNKVHLAGMYPNISKALELLSLDYNIELWAMYNCEHLGEWSIGLPRGVKVKHIQWSMENYKKYMENVDIGIVPACMPINNQERIKKKSRVSRYFLDSQDDYLIRFKMPSNPGRIIVFAKLGVPVVSDIFPSALQFIKDEENGLLAYSIGGWYSALEKLIKSHDLRNEVSAKMLETYNLYFHFSLQNKKFLSFLSGLDRTKDKAEVINEEKTRFIDKFKFNNAYLIDKLENVFKERRK